MSPTLTQHPWAFTCIATTTNEVGFHVGPHLLSPAGCQHYHTAVGTHYSWVGPTEHCEQ